MRLLVCGCRDWTDRNVMSLALTAAETFGKPILLIHGGAKGADLMAAHMVRQWPDWEALEFPADWKTHGKAAGPIRNKQMLDEGRPDTVVAFWDGQSRGTLDMIKRATAAGIPVRIVPAAKEPTQ